MSSSIAVSAHRLSKSFRIYESPLDRVKQAVSPGDRVWYKNFDALLDVSFELRKGETLGVVGKNGSGKSTLLQLICGTLTPSSGELHTVGRIGALLELGSGFNFEFTGRENVVMNATLMGLSSREIDLKMDRILGFADIGGFIDRPIKTYSSGMVLRLAFAVQAQLDPEILIVDEALAVGDARFQAKCFDRLRQLKDDGCSILLVSHATEQIVSHCSEALLLESGRVLEIGEPRRVINRYMDVLFGRAQERSPSTLESGSSSVNSNCGDRLMDFSSNGLSTSDDCFHLRPYYNSHEYRWGDGSALILDYRVKCNGISFPSVFRTGDSVTIEVSVKFFETLVCPVFGITFKTTEGITLYGVNSETVGLKSFREQGEVGSTCRVSIDFCLRLAPGDYFLSLGLATKQGESVVPRDRRYDSIHFKVEPDNSFYGLLNLNASMAVNDFVS